MVGDATILWRRADESCLFVRPSTSRPAFERSGHLLLLRLLCLLSGRMGYCSARRGNSDVEGPSGLLTTSFSYGAQKRGAHRLNELLGMLRTPFNR